MKTLLQMVHPWTLKVVKEEKALVVGDYSEGPYRERDKKIVNIMGRILNDGGRVIIYREFCENFLQRGTQDWAFESTAIYKKFYLMEIRVD